MELETINKLFLELSQITTATTAKELAMQRELDRIDAVIFPSGKPLNYNPDRATKIRTLIKLNPPTP
jgi:hypothetical protein